MIERLREYDAEVVECSPAGTSRRHRRATRRQRQTQLCRPARNSARDGSHGRSRIRLESRSIGLGLTTEIEQAEGVVTAASCGIADSGTIVLHHSATEGRRVLTLLPDWHLCILQASQVVETCLSTSTAF